MPPEAALTADQAHSGGIPPAWCTPLVLLALAWAGLILLTLTEWIAMARLWWDASTYNHVLLVPFILAWLVRLRAPQLARLEPRAWLPGALLFVPGLAAWLGGSAFDVNLVAQVGAVVMLQAALVTLLGLRVSKALLFPLGYMLFLVPFGDEIVPALQTITARIAVELTHLSGIPAEVEGVFIDTPAGLFKVAEACSGVKFLVAMVALGTLVAHLFFVSWRRRALFMAACVVVPVLANGVRAWGTIYVAQIYGIEFAAGFDHIVYGWIFFAIVMSALLALAWFTADSAPPLDLVPSRT